VNVFSEKPVQFRHKKTGAPGKAPVSEKGEYEETIFGTSLPENRR